MKLAEVDRVATLAWCRSPKAPSFLAAGSVAGSVSVDFDTSAQLEIFQLQFAKNATELTSVGKINITDKLYRLSWGLVAQNESLPYGILAGGMESGALGIWNPKKIIESNDAESLISTTSKHTGPIQTIDFNPIQQNLLASGSSDTEIFIWDLNNPSQPSVYTPGAKTPALQNQNITCVSWNKKVQHILASSSFSGQCVIWDLKNKKPVMNFSDVNRKYHCKALAWNPEEATQLVLASEDDASPVIQVWDLRNTYSPSFTLEGHTRGIWSLSWCPFDTSLLVSCAKDNRTVCWNVGTGKILCEVERTQNWNFDVQWSPCTPAILATSSLEGKIRVHALHDTSTVADDSSADLDEFLGKKTPKAPRPAPTNPPPRWIQRPVGASFSFGGKLVYFSKRKQPTGPNVVKIATLSTEKEFVQRANHLEEVIKTQNFQQYCNEKIQSSTNPDDQTVWRFVKVLFEPNARTQLLTYLGFSPEKVVEELNNFVAKQQKQVPAQTITQTPEYQASAPPAPFESAEATLSAEAPEAQEKKEDVADLFGGESDDKDVFASLAPASATAPVFTNPKVVNLPVLPPLPPLSFGSGDGAEDLLSRALVVGNFEAAVDCCIASGNFADALILAECGGKDLFNKTRDAYFQQHSRPFMRIVASIIKKDLKFLIADADVNNWRAILAILCTYATDEFADLCDLLGNRVEKYDHQAATLCYICAGNVERVMTEWTTSFKTSKAVTSDNLLDLVEKVSILRCAIEQEGVPKNIPPNLAAIYQKYAELLASQGLLSTAMEYLSLLSHHQTSESSAFIYRVYSSLPAASRALFNEPSNPFDSAAPANLSVGHSAAATTVPPTPNNQFPDFGSDSTHDAFFQQQQQTQQTQEPKYPQQHQQHQQHQAHYQEQAQQHYQYPYGASHTQQPVQQPQPQPQQSQPQQPQQAYPSQGYPQQPAHHQQPHHQFAHNTGYSPSPSNQYSQPYVSPLTEQAAAAAQLPSPYQPQQAYAPQPQQPYVPQPQQPYIPPQPTSPYVQTAAHPSFPSSSSNAYPPAYNPSAAKPAAPVTPFVPQANPAVTPSAVPPKPAAPAQPAQPPVVTSPDNQKLIDTTNSLLARFQSQFGGDARKSKMVSDAQQKVEVLIKRLQRNEVPDAAGKHLGQLLAALLANDFNASNAIFKDLSQKHWDDLGGYAAMNGLKRLVEVLSK